jgi:putative ABC transport system permease protein
MKLLLVNHIENAIDSLRSTRTRTLLTMLGISIGVASITLILSLSGGATKIISDQVHGLGGNIAVIRPGAPVQPRFDDITSPGGLDFAASTLTSDDIDGIRSVPNVDAIAPLMTISGSVKNDNNVAPARTPIIATTPDLEGISDLTMRDGQFIDSVTNRDTAVVGTQLSIDLFGTDQSIGQTFKIRGQTFTVIGVLKRQNKPINYNNVDFDKAAIISLEAGKSLNHGILQVQQIDVKATSVDKLASVVTGVKKMLDQKHHGEQDYAVLSGEDISRPTSQLFYTFATTMAAVAAVSLVVGGIGIMNIMLVGVAERTREIGIRKSLGASHRHITWQFLIESLAMSVGGGILGYLFGYLLGFIISRSFLTFDPVFNWQIAAITLGISVLIGTLFGLYPALRAARKDPIEALRQYH